MNHLTESELNEYLDDALSIQARRAAEAHLQGCAACRAERDALGSVFSALSALPERSPGRDLSGAVLAGLPHQGALSLGWRLALSVQAGVAVGVFISVAQAATAAAGPLPSLRDLLLRAFATWTAMVTAGPRFTVPDLALSGWSPPSVSIPWQPGQLTALAAIAAILWIAGNASLLRNRTGSRR